MKAKALKVEKCWMCCHREAYTPFGWICNLLSNINENPLHYVKCSQDAVRGDCPLPDWEARADDVLKDHNLQAMISEIRNALTDFGHAIPSFRGRVEATVYNYLKKGVKDE